jgi:biotin carboxyl carrier protein
MKECLEMVRAVFIRPGQNVAAGDPLIQLE